MASETDTGVQCVGKNIPKTRRKLQQQLRSAGLAYVSRTGKIVPAKRVTGELCQCPQKCNDRVSLEARERLFDYFYKMLGDADSQNKCLRAHMDVRARTLPPRPVSPVPPPAPGTRPPRRITCKYLLPLVPETATVEICQKAFCSAFVISTKRVRLQREKLIHSMGLNSYHHQRHVKRRREPEPSEQAPTEAVPQDSGSVSIKVRHLEHPENTPEESALKMMSNITRLVDDPLVPPGISVPDGVTIAPVFVTPDHDRDIAIVNNFFYNQLWKPEYIGTYS